MKTWLVLLILVIACASVQAGPGPVASWDFDEGTGTVLRDSVGENHGDIKGARWVKSGNGYALRFDGVDDYVDCGNGPALDIRKEITLEAWVYPDAPPTGEPGLIGKFYDSYALTFYATGSSYFYIHGGGNGAFGAIKVGQWSHVVGAFDGKTLRFYVNGQEVGAHPTRFDSIPAGNNFLMGCIFGDPTNEDVAMRNTAFFAGMLDAARVYDRALSPEEVIRSYNILATEKGQKPFDTSRFGRLSLQEFVYPERKQAVLAVDYHWVRPIPEGAQIRVDLLRDGNQVDTVLLEPKSTDDTVEAEFSTAALDDGKYVMRAYMEDSAGSRQHVDERSFTLPLTGLKVASPSEKVVPALPPAVKPPAYSVKLAPTGGFTVTFKGFDFPVESTYSYPYGGYNGFSVSPAAEGAEPGWSVKTRQLDKNTYRVYAEGEHYSILRMIRQMPTRIEVQDTIKNKTDDVLGVILSNHIDTRGMSDSSNTLFANPTVFVSRGECGVGLVALDDLYQVQQRNVNSEGLVEIRDEHFGLDKGASYTIEWAVYPTGTGDYYDFINQVRKDEGLNGHAEGSVELTSRWGPPSKEAVELKAIKYPSIAYLTHATRQPQYLSLEGWEFMEYPDIAARLKKALTDTSELYPDLYPQFHVAHSLFFTNKPAELFGDSMLMDVNGNKDHYGPNSFDYYGNYTSREMYDAGWRWWLFYPTMENSFGKYMLKAARYMIDELGAKAMWADGYISGYCKGGYTYDRWDGHSVTIDPKTKTVTRKKCSVTYIALPVLKAVAKMFSDSGGVVITNGKPGPFSYLKNQPVITSCETGGGDQQPVAALHLGTTVTPLGNPTVIKSERDVYRDILAKLDLGALYFFYGEQDFVKEKTLASYMYPITFESIHEGTVRGRERIVTRKPDVYGWPGDKLLHAVYLYDARGKQTPNRFISTVDAKSVRTQLDLREDESAAVVRIPATLETSAPVNVLVSGYGADGIELHLNGRSKATLRVRDGEFSVKAGKMYRVDTKTVAADKDGVLEVSLALTGPTTVKIEPAR